MDLVKQIRVFGAGFLCVSLLVLATPSTGNAQEFACCLPDNQCINTDEATCLGLEGDFVGGPGSRTCEELGGCQLPTTGACCGEAFEGGCADGFTPQGCLQQGGTFDGLGSSCSDSGACEPSTGGEFACCLPGGGCIDVDEATCVGQGGSFVGGPTSRTCAELGDCPTTGACCLNGGAGPCVDAITLDECLGLEGLFKGLGTVCGLSALCVAPPDPVFACCFQAGNCLNITESECAQNGGNFVGGANQVTCEEIGVCPTAADGACCIAGVCSVISGLDCIASGGYSAGPGSACTGDVVCEIGACCQIGICTDLPGIRCVTEGGIFVGAGTTCTTTACGACCNDGVCSQVISSGDCQAEGGFFVDGAACANVLGECPTVNPNCANCAVGACCKPDGSCEEVSVTECSSLDGDHTAGATCDVTFCTGACCLDDGSCLELTEAACTGGDVGSVGSYQGDGSVCTPTLCAPAGACCVDGLCSVLTEEDCTGDYQGDNTVCDPSPCGASGACCFGDGSCQILTQAQCDASEDGDYQSDGTTCEPGLCGTPSGACCLADDTCQFLTEDACNLLGTYQGDFNPCSPGLCAPPTGACCSSDFASGCGAGLSELECSSHNGEFLGAGTTCNDAPLISGLTVVGGNVDAECESTVTFSATVTATCCVTPGGVTVTVAAPGGNAVVGNVVVNKIQNGTKQVDVNGSAVVSNLASCPAVVVVTINAVNCGGLPAAPAQDSVAVNDTVDPVFDTFPSDTTLECPADTSVAANGEPTAHDACGGVIIEHSDVSVAGCGNTEVITRTWTVTDGCGNSISQDQVIAVVDTIAPAITCPADVTVTCPEPTDPSATGTATATDACDPAPAIDYSDVVTPEPCEAEPVMTTIARTWTATDACGNSSACTQTITVLKQSRTVIIKQGACPAPLNRNSNAVIKHVLTGDVDFDVHDVVLSSLELRRCDCVGGVTFPNDGPPGPGIKFKDKNHPNTDDVGCGAGQSPCACNSDNSSDGILDLEIPFRASDMTSDLHLDELLPGALVTLALTGELTNGCKFVAYDCIRLVPPGTPPGMLAVTSNSSGAWTEVTPLDDMLDGGGFGSFERTYPITTVVFVSASEVHESSVFSHFVLDGVPQPRIFCQMSQPILIEADVHELHVEYVDFTAGDMNADGLVDGRDIEGFVFAVMSPMNADCTQRAAANLDGDDEVTPGDLGPFVGLLLSP